MTTAPKLFKTFEIKTKTLITDTKTHFLPLSWEGTAVKSGLNLETQGLTWVIAKPTRHRIASVSASASQPTLGCVQPQLISASHPAARAASAPAAPGPLRGLCWAPKALLKITALIKRGKKALKYPKTWRHFYSFLRISASLTLLLKDEESWYL